MTSSSGVVAVLVFSLAPTIGLLALLAARSPMRALSLYAAVLPFGSGVVLPGPLPSPFNTLSTLLGFIAIGAIALHRLRHPAPGGRLVPAVPMFLLFFAFAMASSFWSVDRRATAENLFVLASLLLLFLLTASLHPTQRQVRELEMAVAGGGAATATFGIWLLITGGLVPTNESVARFATAGGAGAASDPNITAASLLLPLVLAFAGAFRAESRRIRVAAAVCATLTTTGIVLTGSRGGALAGVLGVMVVLLHERRPRALLPWMGGLVIAVAIVLIVFPSGIDQRLTRGGTTGRADIWKVGLRNCNSYCVHGSGFASFPTAYREELLRSPDLTGHGLQDYKAHDIWLAMLVETGIPGLILVALGLWLLLRQVARLPRTLRGPPLAAMVALLISNLFLNNLSFKYFWMVLIYAVLATRAADSSQFVAPASQLSAVATGPGPQATFLREQLD